MICKAKKPLRIVREFEYVPGGIFFEAVTHDVHTYVHNGDVPYSLRSSKCLHVSVNIKIKRKKAKTLCDCHPNTSKPQLAILSSGRLIDTAK